MTTRRAEALLSTIRDWASRLGRRGVTLSAALLAPPLWGRPVEAAQALKKITGPASPRE